MAALKQAVGPAIYGRDDTKPVTLGDINNAGKHSTRTRSGARSTCPIYRARKRLPMPRHLLRPCLLQELELQHSGFRAQQAERSRAQSHETVFAHHRIQQHEGDSARQLPSELRGRNLQLPWARPSIGCSCRNQRVPAPTRVIATRHHRTIIVRAQGMAPANTFFERTCTTPAAQISLRERPRHGCFRLLHHDRLHNITTIVTICSAGSTAPTTAAFAFHSCWLPDNGNVVIMICNINGLCCCCR